MAKASRRSERNGGAIRQLMKFHDEDAGREWPEGRKCPLCGDKAAR